MLAAQLEQLPDLSGYLKTASSPVWHPVRIGSLSSAWRSITWESSPSAEAQAPGAAFPPAPRHTDPVNGFATNERDRVYDHSNRRDIEYKEILLPSHFDRRRFTAGLGQESQPAVECSRALRATEPMHAWPANTFWHCRTNSTPSSAQFWREALPRRSQIATTMRWIWRFTSRARIRATSMRTCCQPPAKLRAAGLGPKTIAELTGSQRFELGLPRAMQEHAQIRERWATMTNDALRDAGLDVRVSHIPDSQSILRPDAQTVVAQSGLGNRATWWPQCARRSRARAVRSAARGTGAGAPRMPAARPQAAGAAEAEDS